MKYSSGTTSVLGRAISAEVRGRLAAERLNLREFSQAAGFASHNYPAIRLRDERPFTADDVQLIANYFEEDPHEFVKKAWQNHSERLYDELLFDRDNVTQLPTPKAPAELVKRAARKTTKPKKP